MQFSKLDNFRALILDGDEIETLVELQDRLQKNSEEFGRAREEIIDALSMNFSGYEEAQSDLNETLGEWEVFSETIIRGISEITTNTPEEEEAKKSMLEAWRDITIADPPREAYESDITETFEDFDYDVQSLRDIPTHVQVDEQKEMLVRFSVPEGSMRLENKDFVFKDGRVILWETKEPARAFDLTVESNLFAIAIGTMRIRVYREEDGTWSVNEHKSRAEVTPDDKTAGIIRSDEGWDLTEGGD